MFFWIEIPSLFQLSTHSIALNVAYHSQIFEQYSDHEGIYRCYKVLQMLTSEHLMAHLECIYYYGNTEDYHLKNLFEFLFRGNIEKYFDVEYMLQFLFNEYRTSLFPLFTKKSRLPEEVFPILSKCTGLRRLEISSVCFEEARFVESLACWPKLVVIDFTTVESNDKIMQTILENCPALQDLRARGTAITDKSMFFLCRNQKSKPKFFSSSFSKIGEAGSYVIKLMGRYCNGTYSILGPFTLCENSMACCVFGRKLTNLLIRETKITREGIACALEHCHLLKKVEECFWQRNEINRISLPLGILLLRNAMILNNQPKLKLKLTMVAFNENTGLNDVRDILECCPDVEQITLDPLTTNLSFITQNSFPSLRILDLRNSISLWGSRSGFMAFLRTKGKQVNTLTIQEINCDHLTARSLLVVLNNFPNIKHFALAYVRISNHNFTERLHVPCCIKYLESLFLIDITTIGLSVRLYFSKLLGEAENVRILVVDGWIAEWALMEAFEENYFIHLREIILLNANLRKVSLEHIIENGTALKKIVHCRCKNSSAFARRHRNAAHKNNFDLEVKAIELEELSIFR